MNRDKVRARRRKPTAQASGSIVSALRRQTYPAGGPECIASHRIASRWQVYAAAAQKVSEGCMAALESDPMAA
jgi:hypothetical protein